MDLSAIRKNFEKERFETVQECLNDIELIFQNSFLYNMGNEVIDLFDNLVDYSIN